MSLHSCYNYIYIEVFILYEKGDMFKLNGRYFKFSMHIVYGETYGLNVGVVDHLTVIF